MLVPQGHTGGVRTRCAAGAPQVTPPRENPPCTPRTPPTQSTHGHTPGPAVSPTPVGAGRVSCPPVSRQRLCRPCHTPQTRAPPSLSPSGDGGSCVTVIPARDNHSRLRSLSASSSRPLLRVGPRPQCRMNQSRGAGARALCPGHVRGASALGALEVPKGVLPGRSPGPPPARAGRGVSWRQAK